MFIPTSTYHVDRPLFKKLGLDLFTFNDQDEHYVGKVILVDYDNSYVELWVRCMPALFWRARVYCAESDKIYNVETGSGSLSTFWDGFKQIAEGMLVIE